MPSLPHLKRAAVVAGTALAASVALSGCALIAATSDRDASVLTQQEEEQMYLEDVQEAVIAASQSISEARARQTQSGLSQQLNLVIAVPEGAISAPDLLKVLAAVEESRPENVEMILLYAVNALGEESSSVSIGPQLAELGVPESWIINEGFATIPVSVLQALVPS